MAYSLFDCPPGLGRDGPRW